MHFDKPTYTVRRASRKKDIPKGLYTKDPKSGETIFTKELEDNLMVAPKSGHHFPIGAKERLARFFDEGTFAEQDVEVKSGDPLQFVDSQPYPERIKRYQKDSGLPEAVVSGLGLVHGIEVSVAVMDFRFCGGAMGAAAGRRSRGRWSVRFSGRFRA
jgi:acetyl-CoA carboxylase carboxyl transferase subunit beta